jgi:hypothetical protein
MSTAPNVDDADVVPNHVGPPDNRVLRYGAKAPISVGRLFTLPPTKGLRDSAGGAVEYPLRVRYMRRRAGRPAGEEAAEKLLAVVVHRKRIDMHAVALEAIYRPVRRGRRCDPRDETTARALKIRHAGGTVVDHRESPVWQHGVVQQGKAGVGRGEDINAGRTKRSASLVGGAAARISRMKPQPASEVASPWTMPTRRPPISATRCMGNPATRACAAGARPAVRRNSFKIRLERITTSSATAPG